MWPLVASQLELLPPLKVPLGPCALMRILKYWGCTQSQGSLGHGCVSQPWPCCMADMLLGVKIQALPGMGVAPRNMRCC